MNLDGSDGLLGALGLTLKNLVAGAVASFVALRFFEGLGTAERWTTFVGGWAIAAYGGPPLNAYLELAPKLEIGIVFLLGLFGMAIAAELIRLIRDTDWKGIVDGLLRRARGS
jgi:hypothetical protein